MLGIYFTICTENIMYVYSVAFIAVVHELLAVVNTN